MSYNDEVKLRTIIVCLALLAFAGAVGYWRWYEWRDHSQDAPILAAARKYGVEPALVKAVVWRESRFDASQHGRAGETGLMQIRNPTAGEWTSAERITNFAAAHLLDPGTNTLAGTWYLQKLLKRYAQTDNPLPYALADYNAGRSNVLKWNQGAGATNSAAFLQQITFPGTKSYIRSVMRRSDHYRPIFPSKPK
jgi:soluble lytic murein transglycosylase